MAIGSGVTLQVNDRDEVLEPYKEIRCWIRADTAGIDGPLTCGTARSSTIFTIFEGTSEIQRMLIGRTVTGLDVRWSDLRLG